MSNEEQPLQQPEEQPEIPEDAIVVAQVQYAWLWSSWWLLAIVAALFAFGVFPDPFTPAVLVLIVIVPKYWQWRRTRYYLTESTLIYQRGGITRTMRYQIPLSRLTDTRTRYGLFGRALGFQHVDIMLDNGAVASLAYVPLQMDVVRYFRERMGSDGSAESEDSDSADDDGDMPSSDE